MVERITLWRCVTWHFTAVEVAMLVALLIGGLVTALVGYIVGFGAGMRHVVDVRRGLGKDRLQ